jgi:hypothetical protein
MIDWSIHFGNVIEVLLLFLGLVVAFTRLNDKVAVLHNDLVQIKNKVEELSNVIVQQAISNHRMQTVEAELRELKNQLRKNDTSCS